ncbi:RICIN domain-containing protein [Streptomyces sp. L2]|uniref:RICIN domain-containing protein n=1 Tax=Streptomyces sp. L2 TaxID=2162665 RepID=UPI001F5155E8|nr:RICIN domain-containing protein [Streptomyces sp. L2]
MQSRYPPRPPYPPDSGPLPGESDRDLVAQLTGPADSRHHAVALLLARHWRATCDYAAVCLATTGPAAQLAATTAFHHVLGRLTGGTVRGALRPHLLVAVRETVRTWAADDVICAVVPELRKPTGGRGLRAAPPGTAERRHLAARAFRALPDASQCLLWHTEVEAEPINIPAGLLGVETAAAESALERAREQFRTVCVRAHRELAPTKECRFYNRLLDVSLRRGSPLLADVGEHLTACRHCRHAADQLGLFEGALDILLAEAVLGWGARRYLAARPGRGAPEAWTATASRTPYGEPAGRHRTAALGGRRTAVAVGVGLASLALLATVLVVRSWSDDNGVPGPHATWGAPAGHAPRPGASTGASTGTRTGPGTGGIRPSGADSSAASAGEPVPLARGTLRNLDSGLCLDLPGDGSRPGAEVREAACSTAGSQQWTYQDDGLLRSALDPLLCLAADPVARRVTVAGCVVHAGEVVYDVTVRGEILLRGHKGLSLAVTPGHVVVARRNGSREQRWALGPGLDGLPGDSAAPDTTRPTATGPTAPGDGNEPPGEDALPGANGRAGRDRGKAGQGTERSGRGPERPRQWFTPRIAQAGADDTVRAGGGGDPGSGLTAAAPGPVTAAVSPVTRAVAAAPAAVGTLLG